MKSTTDSKDVSLKHAYSQMLIANRKTNDIKTSNTSHKDIPKIQMIKQLNAGRKKRETTSRLIDDAIIIAHSTDAENNP